MTPKTFDGVLEGYILVRRMDGTVNEKATIDKIAHIKAEIVGLLPSKKKYKQIIKQPLETKGWNAYRKQTLINFGEKGGK